VASLGGGIDRGELGIIVGATLLNAAIALTVFTLAGTGSDGTELALRTTARVSFVWFMLAFVASPLARLRPGPLAEWLVHRRRALGVVFGLSMSIHVLCIRRLFVLHAPARPPMVTNADFWIGIPGLVLVALLTITSAHALRRRLGPVAWGRLHRTGIWVVWSIFFLCLIDSVGRKETDHPVLAYYVFIAVLLFGLGLRVAARFTPTACESLHVEPHRRAADRA
jgi:DMSO/TMAO reductase YedYZ heme-binding membrane subunit